VTASTSLDTRVAAANLDPAGRGPDRSAGSPFHLSIVTCAYNEEANIGRFLRSCLDSRTEGFGLQEIVVVASGCTDRTEAIVSEFAERDPRVRLYTQPTRQGKASALALGLRHAGGDLVLVAGSDTAPAPGALEEVVRPFTDPTVSLVCTRPTPMNTSGGFVVSLARTMWDLHSVVSAIVPKPGEAFAVRNREFDIPADVQDDDTFLGSVSIVPGTRAVFAPNAVFYNRVPTTAPDFLRQRWRINRQELGLKRSTGIEASTWEPQLMVRAMGTFLREKPGAAPYVLTLAAAEGVVRIGAIVATALNKKPMVHWEPIRSTKDTRDIAPGKEGVRPPP
jgi:poly-beta-1,6-N-acetyl-D-glucosamine synthase